MKYAATAKGLASLGRNGDTVLMHMNPKEVAGLSAILGPPTINPETGLPEAFGWAEILGGVALGVAAAATGGAAAAAAPALMGLEAGTTAASLAATGAGALTGAAVNTAGQAAINAATGKQQTGLGLGVSALTGAVGGGMAGSAVGDAAAKAAEGVSTGAGVGTEAGKAATAAVPSGTVTAGADGIPVSSTVQPTDITGIVKQAPQLPQSTTTGLASQEVSPLQVLGGGKTGFEGAKNFVSNYGMPIATGASVSATANDMGQPTSNTSAANYANQQNTLLGNIYSSMYDQSMPSGAGYNPSTGTPYSTGNIFSSPAKAAEGGIISANVGNTPVSMNIPQGDISKFQQGLTALSTGYANGGYLNTQPIIPGQFHPQSQIPSAQPRPGASPIRQDVLSGYARGGYAKGNMIDGPGDGMSDDVPAEVDGHAPVRLADSEYVIPADTVGILGNGSSKAGAKFLDNMVKGIRAAGYGTTEQVKQNAGKLAAEKMIARQARRSSANKRGTA